MGALERTWFIKDATSLVGVDAEGREFVLAARRPSGHDLSELMAALNGLTERQKAVYQAARKYEADNPWPAPAKYIAAHLSMRPQDVQRVYDQLVDLGIATRPPVGSGARPFSTLPLVREGARR
jgi:hypothetical protein